MCLAVLVLPVIGDIRGFFESGQIVTGQPRALCRLQKQWDEKYVIEVDIFRIVRGARLRHNLIYEYKTLHLYSIVSAS